MSRKHNCPKRGMRSKSRYRDRLRARGLKTTPAMDSVDDLRKHQSSWRWQQAWERGGLRYLDAEGT